MKHLFLALILISALAFKPADEKKYLSKSGHVEFSSHTPMEDIFAQTDQAVSRINATTGEVDFGILIVSFKFKNALMEEHFNENYIESAKFPKATFKGKISNLAAINFAKDGDYPTTIEGNMTIHGVTKPLTVKGILRVKGTKVTAIAKFSIIPQDYGIKIPDLVKEKIAKEMAVSVNVEYSSM